MDNEGIKLIVYISDPGRKKSRTDAGANNKELYVQGLSKFVKEADLRKLFEEVSFTSISLQTRFSIVNSDHFFSFDVLVWCYQRY